MNPEIYLIAHDMRSAHNVGALLRVADGMNVQKVYFTGYTPYPASVSDHRLPHVAEKLHKQIKKTALGAESTVPWTHNDNVAEVLSALRDDDVAIVGLEQSSDSMSLPEYRPPKKLALLLGREVEGIASDLLKQCDLVVEIPMLGQKESHNVVQAAALALYHCRFVK